MLPIFPVTTANVSTGAFSATVWYTVKIKAMKWTVKMPHVRKVSTVSWRYLCPDCGWRGLFYIQMIGIFLCIIILVVNYRVYHVRTFEFRVSSVE